MLNLNDLIIYTIYTLSYCFIDLHYSLYMAFGTPFLMHYLSWLIFGNMTQCYGIQHLSGFQEAALRRSLVYAGFHTVPSCWFNVGSNGSVSY
jgi:hypothetical protein